VTIALHRSLRFTASLKPRLGIVRRRGRRHQRELAELHRQAKRRTGASVRRRGQQQEDAGRKKRKPTGAHRAAGNILPRALPGGAFSRRAHAPPIHRRGPALAEAADRQHSGPANRLSRSREACRGDATRPCPAAAAQRRFGATRSPSGRKREQVGRAMRRWRTSQRGERGGCRSDFGKNNGEDEHRGPYVNVEVEKLRSVVPMRLA